MRWTRQRRETNACGRGRRSRVVLALRCRRQGRGVFRERRWQPSMVTEESPKETVKTIAQGMPVDLADPVVTAACFFCCRRAMGEAITRHSLRPLRFPRAKLPAALGR